MPSLCLRDTQLLCRNLYPWSQNFSGAASFQNKETGSLVLWVPIAFLELLLLRTRCQKVMASSIASRAARHRRAAAIFRISFRPG